MAKYAEGTEVSVESSKAEIERIINKYGGEMPSFGWRSPMEAVVGFRYKGVLLRYIVETPNADDPEFTRAASGRARTPVVAASYAKAEMRRRWRVLVLRLKLKFEVVSGDPDLFYAEFLPNTLLPDGKTVETWMVPQIKEAYLGGQMPNHFLLTEGHGDD